MKDKQECQIRLTYRYVLEIRTKRDNMDSSDNAKQFAVNWNNHMNHIKRAFDGLLKSSELTDVTLYAEGKKVGAHKLLLSACSSYFKNLFVDIPQEHPIVVLKGVRFAILTDILKFIYNGEVSIDSDVFDTFLQTAEFLQISGLTNSDKNGGGPVDELKKQDSYFDCSDENLAVSKVKKLSPPDVKDKSIKRSYSNEDTDDVQVKKPKNDREAFGPLKCTSTELPVMFGEQVDSTHNYTSNMFEATGSHIFFEDTFKGDGNERKSTTGPHGCEICGKSYRLKDSLYKHLSVHSGNTTCNICSKVLSRKTHLERHMIMTHGVHLNSNPVKDDTPLIKPP